MKMQNRETEFRLSMRGFKRRDCALIVLESSA